MIVNVKGSRDIKKLHDTITLLLSGGINQMIIYMQRAISVEWCFSRL